MPSLNISLPGVPTLLTGLSPVAASPIAATDGAAPPAFASVMDGLGSALDASPPLQLPPTGTNLPPQRPDVAGAPAPLPELDVEAVMVGSAGPVPGVAPTTAAAPAPITVAGDEPAPQASPASPDPGPIACGLDIGKPGMPRAPQAKPGAPAPVQLPPEPAVDLPDADPSAPAADTDKAVPSQPAPGQAADAPPPAPGFAPVAWTPPPPQQAEAPGGPETGAVAAEKPAQPAAPPAQPGPVPAQADPGSPPAQPGPAPAQAGTGSPPATAAQQPVTAPQPAAPQQATALPHSFTLPPEVARDIAQLVKAAVGERDGHDSRSAGESAPLAAATSSPLPQPAVAPPAPLHPSFAAVHRPVIDTGRAEWVQAMIDRIAEMPQPEGGRRDAQIRLVPDALGPVDVKIEQRQERLHVTLNAETPQARQLLSDAAPRLHELAEARGIRFAHTGFGGAESHDRRQAPDQQPAAPTRPRPTESAAAESDFNPDGDLIA
ncbi:hypothetical protein GON01_13810 [Sphingomonas sp. MAH-20]|uniref:Flagellar hook-length control protein-like C-terminal domain-containing protein n=1 Tax=Sphingomonas horti TaxID=2682842 RepID=A0A6I4J3V9_9SPHN|nr:MULTISPECIES: flagellar hook-length control protein FliK [Sphingomonas]MBA2918974.1 flagellar hook-length control protein FliK [Sphingomonas sp. CGMCC 1.13658]MVO79007.1 hypothetical protein [Sphingomonas horti]